MITTPSAQKDLLSEIKQRYMAGMPADSQAMAFRADVGYLLSLLSERARTPAGVESLQQSPESLQPPPAGVEALVEPVSIEAAAEAAHNNYWADEYKDATDIEKAAARQQARAIAKVWGLPYAD